MTDNSLILGLPYIQPSQAQKHVTHNEALRVLDALVQLSVLARDLTLPPAGAAAGDRYLVASPGQAEWAGQSDAIAIYDGLNWTFLTPQTGWQAYVVGEGTTVVFNGTDWQGRDVDTVDSLGVNASADAFNRLFYFERAAETYIKALWTGQPLRVLSEEIAEKTAREIEEYDDQAGYHFSDLKEILDREEPDYKN